MTIDDFLSKYANKSNDLFTSILGSWKGFVAFYKRRVRSVLTDMDRSIRQFKIFDSVICFIVVFVMDYLMRFKIPTQLFFHYKSVLSNITTSCRGVIRGVNHYVSLMKNPTAFPFIVFIRSKTRSLTGTRTENTPASFVALVVGKCFSTLITLKNTFTRFIVARSIAESSLLTWRSFEKFITEVTSVNHMATL